jgi:hypothetical protein
MVADPLTIPDFYGLANIGGVLTPGVIPINGVKGWKRSKDWDEKKAKGSSGATLTDQGEPLAKGSFTFHLWRRDIDPPDFVDDFVQWELLKGVLSSSVGEHGKKINALPVIYPLLNQLDITDVVVESIGQLENMGAGLWSVTIELREFRPPKPSGGTPKASGWTAGPGADGKPPKTAQDQQDKDLDELVEEAKK